MSGIRISQDVVDFGNVRPGVSIQRSVEFRMLKGDKYCPEFRVYTPDQDIKLSVEKGSNAFKMIITLMLEKEGNFRKTIFISSQKETARVWVTGNVIGNGTELRTRTARSVSSVDKRNSTYRGLLQSHEPIEMHPVPIHQINFTTDQTKKTSNAFEIPKLKLNKLSTGDKIKRSSSSGRELLSSGSRSGLFLNSARRRDLREPLVIQKTTNSKQNTLKQSPRKLLHAPTPIAMTYGKNKPILAFKEGITETPQTKPVEDMKNSGAEINEEIKKTPAETEIPKLAIQMNNNSDSGSSSFDIDMSDDSDDEKEKEKENTKPMIPLNLNMKTDDNRQETNNQNKIQLKLPGQMQRIETVLPINSIGTKMEQQGNQQAQMPSSSEDLLAKYRENDNGDDDECSSDILFNNVEEGNMAIPRITLSGLGERAQLKLTLPSNMTGEANTTGDENGKKNKNKKKAYYDSANQSWTRQKKEVKGFNSISSNLSSPGNNTNTNIAIGGLLQQQQQQHKEGSETHALQLPNFSLKLQTLRENSSSDDKNSSISGLNNLSSISDSDGSLNVSSMDDSEDDINIMGSSSSAAFQYTKSTLNAKLVHLRTKSNRSSFLEVDTTSGLGSGNYTDDIDAAFEGITTDFSSEDYFKPDFKGSVVISSYKPTLHTPKNIGTSIIVKEPGFDGWEASPLGDDIFKITDALLQRDNFEHEVMPKLALTPDEYVRRIIQ